MSAITSLCCLVVLHGLKIYSLSVCLYVCMYITPTPHPHVFFLLTHSPLSNLLPHTHTHFLLHPFPLSLTSSLTLSPSLPHSLIPFPPLSLSHSLTPSLPHFLFLTSTLTSSSLLHLSLVSSGTEQCWSVVNTDHPPHGTTHTPRIKRSSTLL